MAEVEFEDNCAEIKDYLRTVRECKQHITQIPSVLGKLLEMLNTSTELLEDLCTFDDAPDSLQRQCVRSRQQMIRFYEGSALKDLTDSIQAVVHQRLMRMEQIAQQSYTACKRRREARAKYLSDTSAKGPFNLAAASPEKLQRHKAEYTERDESYRRACDDFAQYRYQEMGTAQKDFYSGYSGVFALLTNALNLPEEGRDDETAATTSNNTRDRMRGKQPRPSRSLRAPVHQVSPQTLISGAGEPQGEAAPPLPSLTAEESDKTQRRLSRGSVVDKPAAAAAAAAVTPAASAGSGGSWRRTSSMRSGEVVDGIPVLGGHAYGEEMYTYMSSPLHSTAGAPWERTSVESPSAESCVSGNCSSSSRAYTVEGDASTAGAAHRNVLRTSSSATINHYDSVTPDTPPLQHGYSMFNTFDDS